MIVIGTRIRFLNPPQFKYNSVPPVFVTVIFIILQYYFCYTVVVQRSVSPATSIFNFGSKPGAFVCASLVQEIRSLVLNPFESYKGFVLEGAEHVSTTYLEFRVQTRGSRLCFLSTGNPVVNIQSLWKLHTFQIGKRWKRDFTPSISHFSYWTETFVCTFIYKIQSTIRLWAILRSNSEKKLKFWNQTNLFRNIKTR